MTPLNYIKKDFIIFFLFFFLGHLGYSFELLQQTEDVLINKEGDELKEVKTQKGTLKIILNKNKFDIFSNTNLIFSKDSIKLNEGELRITAESFEGLKITTPVGVVSIVNNGDYIIQYQSEMATVMVVVLEGSALIQGQYREESLNLQLGEKGGFAGIRESDGPAFDILLKGRKSVRGKLVGPDKLTEEQKNNYHSLYSLLLKPKIVKIIKAKPKPGEICHDPFAKFNDCVWRCEGAKKQSASCDIKKEEVSCLRERCLANGQWGDRTVLQGEAKSACDAKKIKIDPCPY